MIKKIRIILGYISICISSLLFLILSLLIILDATILNQDYLINKINEINYQSKLYQAIKKEMTYYTEQSGFKDDIIDDIFTEDDIRENINNLIKNIYNGTSYEINTISMEETLHKKIDTYLEKENFTITNKEEIDVFVKEMANIYKEKIKVTSYIDNVSGVIPKIKKIINISILILSSISLFILILNKFVFLKDKNRIVLISNSFLLISIYLYIKNKIDVNHLLIFDKSLSQIMINIINNILSIILIVAIAYFIIGIVLSLLKKGKKKRR